MTPTIDPDYFDPESYIEHQEERKSQPYKTNHLIEDLLGLQSKLIASQTPKWINFSMLILVAITLGVSIWALLHSYNLI